MLYFYVLLLSISKLMMMIIIMTSGQSNLIKDRIATADGQFSRIRQVAQVCPAMWVCPAMQAHWRNLANTIKLGFLRPTGVHNPNGNSICSAVSAQRTAESPYTLQTQLCSIERGSIQCTNRNRNLHISKMRFLFFWVSFTIEWKVCITKFYLYMGFGADVLKKTAEI